ncbi:MAG TPA: sulfotransferase [Alphaproteobacteria bacterium]|jgi:hypothetical protein|nr:sulfotransferase [Alphaproteobacteria bacterium]
MADAKRLIFIAGAEGSGTTLLLRLLAGPATCVALGGNYRKIPVGAAAEALAAAFDVANQRAWDRTLSIADHEKALADWRRAADAIAASPYFADRSRLIYKRSYPFGTPRGRFSPVLADVADQFEDSRIVAIYRDPRAASYSALRRGFDTDIRRLAIVCAEQLTLLAAEVRALPPERVRVVDYGALLSQPEAVLGGLYAFCGIPADSLRTIVAREGIKAGTDMRFAKELLPSEAAWLNTFFDARRLKQWDNLLPPD